MYGILTDLNFTKHWIFSNYFLGLKNVFGEKNIKTIHSINDLSDISVLFIGDEQYAPNKNIWMNELFINECNKRNIRIIIFNNEKIFNSSFPWNEEIQRCVNTFENYSQLVYDVDDSDILNVPINKTFMSKDYKKNITISNDKKDKVVFVGAGVNNELSYEKRKILLDTISKHIDIDIIPTNPSWSMIDYLQFISSYKYVLSPLGNANSVTMRYYESLFVNSIPLQQSTDNILIKFNNEIKNNWGMFFTDIEHLLNNMENNNYSECNYYMEDFINDNVLNLI